MSRSERGSSERDPYTEKATRENYPSRASYKLIDIQDRFGIIEKGDAVLDLGSSPGGWTKVALDLGARRVVAVDPVPMRFTDVRVHFLQSEMELCLGSLIEEFDVVLSDAAPSTSGCHSLDQAKSIDLGEKSLKYCELYLKRGGNLVVKVFQGDLYPQFFGQVKSAFRYAKPYSPRASKRGSSEIYLIGRSFRGQKISS
jgi:23S rRNA (uridine2552-2'-O)-methyltransferase